MPYVLVYITTRFGCRLSEFVKDWYLGGFKIVSREAVELFEKLDRIFALHINLKYIFHPLYQDRTVIGYILGFIFRSFRIITAFIIYIIISIFFVALYLIWLSIPLYIIYQIFIAYFGQISFI